MTPDDIDRIISAEIPIKTSDIKMYKLVKRYMIHGPCTNLKGYVEATMSNDNGYPLYRRCNNGRMVNKKKKPLDNGFVVPYNRMLLEKYRYG